MAVSDSASEAIWINRPHAELTLNPHKQLFFFFGDQYSHKPLLIYIDGTGSMSLAHNPRHHDRTKHIDVFHHFIRVATDRTLTCKKQGKY